MPLFGTVPLAHATIWQKKVSAKYSFFKSGDIFFTTRSHKLGVYHFVTTVEKIYPGHDAAMLWQKNVRSLKVMKIDTKMSIFLKMALTFHWHDTAVLVLIFDCQRSVEMSHGKRRNNDSQEKVPAKAKAYLLVWPDVRRRISGTSW